MIRATLTLVLLPAGVILSDIGTSFQALGNIFVGYLPGIFFCALVVEGLFYVGALDNPQNQSRIKMAMIGTVIGAIMVVGADAFVTIFSANVK